MTVSVSTRLGSEADIVATATTPTIPTFNANLYTGITNTTPASTVTDNLIDYSDWTFQAINAVTTTDILTISGSLDGVNFTVLPVQNLATGTIYINGQIVTDGLYKIVYVTLSGAPATENLVKPLPLRAIKVAKTGTGTAVSQVIGIGGWSI